MFLKNIKSGIGYYPFWFTRLQGLLYILAFITFGIGDSISGLWMIGERGIMNEANPLARHIIYEYSLRGFIEFKIWITIMVLLIPFMVRGRESNYWMTNGYLFSFIAAGTLATIMNYSAAQHEDFFLSPGQVIIIFLGMVCLLTYSGDKIDRMTGLEMRGYYETLQRDAITMISVLYSDILTHILKKDMLM